jgi:two-component system response regulator AtoC
MIPSMPEILPKILVVDDDRHTRILFDRLLARTAVVSLAVDGAEARRLFAAEDFNLVLMDQRLPSDNGIDLLREFRARRPHLVGILMTGFADVRDAVAAVREGVFDYLTKPFEDLEALEAVIGKALELDRAYREIHGLRARLSSESGTPEVIAQSPAMERVLGQIRQIAGLDTTVLLEGESGTGKELAARLIHSLSKRADKQFLEVNCGGLPETLLESLLFGYEKGAFTGAGQANPGYFEKAHGGNLFLDEIVDMSPKLQSSLLRVLQDHSFTRIGSTQGRRADFRLICATNRSLLGEVKAGRFREDLYYRIAVVTVGLPPLRERAGDIVPLTAYFLDHYNAKFGKASGPLTPAALQALERCRWGGQRARASALHRAYRRAARGRSDRCRAPVSRRRAFGARSAGRGRCAGVALPGRARGVRAAILPASDRHRRREHVGGGAPLRHPAAESLCAHEAMGDCH